MPTHSKGIIRNNFNSAASSYEEVAQVQRQSAADLVALCHAQLPNFVPASILDIGVGTGFVVEELLPHFPHSRYTLNDCAQHMLARTEEKLSAVANVDFHLGDAEACAFTPHDLVISNLTFQWFADLPAALAKFYEISQVLAFATLGSGNLGAWYEFWGAPPALSYPTMEQLKDYCLALKPQRSVFLQRAYPIAFSSPLAGVRYFRKLGAHVRCNPTGASWRRLKRHAREIVTSYEVLFGLLMSEEGRP